MSVTEFGYLRFFRRSVRDISDTMLPSLSTTGRRPTFALRSTSTASSVLMDTDTVCRFSVVITSRSLVSGSTTRSMSRFDTMPNSFSPSLPCSVIGKPEKPYSALMRRQSATVFSGDSTVGSRITPLRYIFTSCTSCACSSMVQLLCTTPRPPCCAIAMAMACSVTVSMQELTNGTFSLMLRLKRLDRSTWSVGKLMKPTDGQHCW